MTSSNRLINYAELRYHVEAKPVTEGDHFYKMLVEVFIDETDKHGTKLSEKRIGQCKATLFDRPAALTDEAYGEDACKIAVRRLDSTSQLRDFLLDIYDDSGRYVQLSYMRAHPALPSLPGAYLVDPNAAILSVDVLAVDPAHRQHGVGRQMLDAICVEVKKRMDGDARRWFAVVATDTVSGEGDGRGGREATRLAKLGVETFLAKVGFLVMSVSKWWVWDLPEGK